MRGFFFTFNFWIFILLLGLQCSNLWAQEPSQLATGKIYSAFLKAEIDKTALLEQMAQYDIIYLSEHHDNAEDHAAQKWLIEHLVEKGIRPQVGFEFFSVEQTSILLNYTQPKPSSMFPVTQPNLAHLRQQLGWQARSDDEWEFYSKILEVGKNFGLTCFGTDLSSSLIQRLARHPLSALSMVEQSLVPALPEVSETYRHLMFLSFKESHCGYSNADFSARLWTTWQARNQRMALSLIAMVKDTQKQPVLMILGAGHSEFGLGLPAAIQRHRPDLKQLNLGFVEIDPTKKNFTDYALQMNTNLTTDSETWSFPFDILWFTTPPQRGDPCSGFQP